MKGNSGKINAWSQTEQCGEMDLGWETVKMGNVR